MISTQLFSIYSNRSEKAARFSSCTYFHIQGYFFHKFITPESQYNPDHQIVSDVSLMCNFLPKEEESARISINWDRFGVGSMHLLHYTQYCNTPKHISVVNEFCNIYTSSKLELIHKVLLPMEIFGVEQRWESVTSKPSTWTINSRLLLEMFGCKQRRLLKYTCNCLYWSPNCPEPF